MDLHRLLIDRGLTLGVCESCTGGMLGAMITSRPGSSAYFLGGIIAYSDIVKRRLVGIRSGVIKKYGAVSAQTAAAMARRVRILTRSDIGVGITGIAGPDGGNPRKPVGLVYVAAVERKRSLVRELHLRGGREIIRRRACRAALDLVLELIGRS